MTAESITDGIKKAALELLAEVAHLWVDSYIAKNPNSEADDSISGSTFDKVFALLEANGITVDYCGWQYRLAASPVVQSAGEKATLPANYDEDADLDRVEKKYSPMIRTGLLQVIAERERQLAAALSQVGEMKQQNALDIYRAELALKQNEETGA